MKYLILAFVLSLSSIVDASNWMPQSKILAESNQAFQLESECLRVSGEDCFDVGENPSKVYSAITLKGQIEECLDEADCDSKFVLKSCNPEWSPIKNYNLLEIYCVKQSVELDQVKLSAYQSELSLAIQAQAAASAKASVKVLRECLAGVIDLLVLRNASKNLTEPQVEAMVTTYAPIMNLLHAVSANTAKTKISEVVADGTLVTEADKTALIAEINKCLGI